MATLAHTTQVAVTVIVRIVDVIHLDTRIAPAQRTYLALRITRKDAGTDDPIPVGG
jgi:hypothetical protein